MCSFLSGKFRERASILHKMAKKWQVEDGEKRNESANRVGKDNIIIMFLPQFLFRYIGICLRSICITAYFPRGPFYI